MSVHCDVCGDRIFSALNNEGSFETNQPFQSWAPFSKNHKIVDSCESCGIRIKNEIKKALEGVVARTVDAIRTESNRSNA